MKYKNEDSYIDCDGIKVHYKLDLPLEQKEGMPVLVLIPGFTGHIDEDHIIAVGRAANEAGFAVLRAEMYGHGKSGGDFHEHNILLWMSEASRVVRYAASLPFAGNIYLAGHSQGGLTAVLAGGVMADVIKALIPLSPAMNIPYDARRGKMLEAPFDNDDLPDEIICPSWSLSSDYIRIARVLPIDECIEMYKGPVLIVHGTDDADVPYRFGKELSERYENARLIPIEGDTHCYDLHLDQVALAVKDFLIEQEGI